MHLKYILLHPERKKLFALQWGNSNTGWKVQLTWTVEPQGLKNSPIVFGNQLAEELESWKKEILHKNLLQYRLHCASNHD